MTESIRVESGDGKVQLGEVRTWARDRVASHKASWGTALGRFGRYVAAARGYASSDFRNVRKEREPDAPDRFPPAYKLEVELVALVEAGQNMAAALAPVQELLSRFGYVAVPAYRRSSYRGPVDRPTAILLRHVGALVSEVLDALEDGRVDESERERIRGVRHEVLEALALIDELLAGRVDSYREEYPAP